MTEQQQLWFDKLYQKRNNTATTLMDDFAISNMWHGVVEKYSDQAHFIYELLQNANDAKATKSSFQLAKNGLYFKHNGTRKFWVSNPDNEKQDQQNNKLGDINAITAVAQSNKKDHSTIGKFGVGFKAVFQYTETPHIYDPNFQFKIERFIIPVKLANDLANRKEDETVFYFPFNKAGMPPEKAYSDILGKLKDLVFPTLFLSSLEEVIWSAENETGEYTKKITGKRKQVNDIFYEKIELYQQIGLQQIKEKLYLFSRCTEENHSYSIGFFLDEKDKLTPKTFSAFCFFPTKETTNLKFILHAPFLLNDSREGIRSDEDYNKEMVVLLAQLSADSLIILKDLKLIDDNIINIISYKEKDFYSENSNYGGFIDKDDPKLFAPFYEAIKKKFETEELLPTIDNYAERQNAYWARDNPVLNLFTDEQLAMLIEDENAKWVFRNFVRNQTEKDEELRKYIDNCTNDWYEMRDLLGYMDADFIESQSDEWLHKLYEYLSKNSSYWDDIKTKPIFLDQERNAVPAFKKEDKIYFEILFIPSDNLKLSSKTIHSDFLKNEKTKEIFESFGIKKPSLKDEINIHILPLYETNEGIDTRPHFELFFKYWKTEGRPEEFINLISNKSFILYKTNDNETRFRGHANEVYYPNDELQKYFEAKPSTKFVDLEDYYTFITEEEDRKTLKEFLLKLGVNKLPEYYSHEINYFEKRDIKDIDGKSLLGGTKYEFTISYFIDGCSENLDEILEKYNAEKSFMLWETLRKFQDEKESLDKVYVGEHRYFYRKDEVQYFENIELKRLRNEKWLLSNNEEFVAPSEITINELADGYERNIELERLLGFKPTVVLTEAEKKIQILNKFENEGFDINRIIKLIEKEKRKLERKASVPYTEVDIDDLKDAIESLENLSETVSKPKLQKEKTNKLPDFDEDEEFAQGIEDLKKQLEIKKSRVDLVESINKSLKYTYDWFKAYLKLLTTYAEKQDTQKQKSISFQEIKPYKADNKYFLLCGASSYISPEIENAEDFKVSLIFGRGKKENITVEGVSKKGQDLLIYCREPLSNNTFSRLSNIFKVEINFTPVIDLLDRLYKAFTNSNNIDSWQDIRKAIPSLDYIYGPPGTGKTTTICKKINEFLDSDSNAKILVLTPTNKAADVVCKKLQDINPNIYAVRLSKPTDPELEEHDIYRDTIDSEDIYKINVVASTIHRLPYFDIKEIGLLFQYNWDYVIFDESSMIGLHYITFALMALNKTNPNTKFIISGDPKQIPPIIGINDKELESFDFPDENIYKMMNLESFNPEEQIIREIDTIQNLNTQYRTVPQIGQLFSELSYSSLLKHDRATNRKETKQLPEKLKDLISSNVIFVDIPLNRDNSIFKVNRLLNSSYHTYCAILVAEIIKYFDTLNQSEQWTIGLIAPYKAQATLLNKLITSYGISENIKVYSDTVHGFQGDECDIVFFVCNPNNYSYSGDKRTLLSKEYIYNVAISRAKDFLIVLHPYTAIQNNKFINEIGLSYKNNFGNARILNAREIERILFKDENYIENNSYISGHDNVNVFGLSEMKYFIKANDTAIDIQLRDIKDHKTNGLTTASDLKHAENESQNGGLKIVGKIDLSKFEKCKKRKPNG